MQDYKITAAVKRDPWSNEYGKFQTYAVQFEGNDNWIQWNKKFKGGEEPTPPKHGDEVYGEISNGKFKIFMKDGGFTPGASKSSFKSEPKTAWKDNSSSIEAQSAVKSAAQVFAGTGADYADVEKMARQLHNLIAVLANGDTPSQPKESLPPVDAYDDITDEIDMSKIPF